MSTSHTGNVQPSIDNEEHISKGNIHAKKTAGYTYDPTSDSLVPGGGGMLSMPFDDILFSNPTASGKYQTGTVKSNGTTVATLTFTYDASDNVSRITKS